MGKLFRVMALVGVLALVGATPALGAGAIRPISGVGHGIDSMGDPAVCTPAQPIHYVNTGVGRVLHLGVVTYEVNHCTSFDPASGTGAFGPGTLTIEAANGDTLVLAERGTFRFVPTGDTVLSYIDLVWEVVDGTGRFEGATGSGAGAPVGDVLAGTLTLTFWGSISY
jgi:hypothetical protein